MTIAMTADGLKEMNTAVYSDASMVNSGYSDCTLRITYAATVNSSADVVYGDNGNPNEVVLTWKRTSQNSYDTLKDDAKVFTYGLELTKLFSDGKGVFSKVQFIMLNKTDGYYVKANLEHDQVIDQTQQLQETLLAGPEILDAFDEELFCEMIDRITVQSNTQVHFWLKNGLELTESIERTVR